MANGEEEEDRSKRFYGEPIGMLPNGKLNVISPDNPELKRRLAEKAKREKEASDGSQ